MRFIISQYLELHFFRLFSFAHFYTIISIQYTLYYYVILKRFFLLILDIVCRQLAIYAHAFTYRRNLTRGTQKNNVIYICSMRFIIIVIFFYYYYNYTDTRHYCYRNCLPHAGLIIFNHKAFYIL